MRPRKQKGRRTPKIQLDSAPTIVRKGSHLEVCVVRGGKVIKHVGSVGVALANDARRYGEDLLAKLLDRARRDLERNQSQRADAD